MLQSYYAPPADWLPMGTDDDAKEWRGVVELDKKLGTGSPESLDEQTSSAEANLEDWGGQVSL